MLACSIWAGPFRLQYSQFNSFSMEIFPTKQNLLHEKVQSFHSLIAKLNYWQMLHINLSGNYYFVLAMTGSMCTQSIMAVVMRTRPNNVAAISYLHRKRLNPEPCRVDHRHTSLHTASSRQDYVPILVSFSRYDSFLVKTVSTLKYHLFYATLTHEYIYIHIRNVKSYIY